MKIDFDKYNTKVKGWGKDTIAKMRGEGAALGIKHRQNSPSKSPSMPKLRDVYRMQHGQIVRISIKFPRVLIYTHKGAGKGRGGSKGSTWVDKYGNSKSTNPESKGKLATGGRVAKPFINNVLDRPDGVEELATIVAVETGDAITNKMLIK